MKFLVIFGFVFLLCALASPVYGEIYAWTDAKGIMHFTNYHPPPQAKLFIRDVKPRRHETDDEQSARRAPEKPALERHEIQEEVEEKLEETIRRIEDFERNLETAEILNQGLTRKLIEANQRVDAALAYAENLEFKIREDTALLYSDTLRLNAMYRFPIRYRNTYPIIIHKPNFRQKPFHSKRHSIKRHYKKYPKKSHYKRPTGRTHFSKRHSIGIVHKNHLGSRHFTKPHPVGNQHKRQIGSRHVRKSYRVGARTGSRFSHRNVRR